MPICPKTYGLTDDVSRNKSRNAKDLFSEERLHFSKNDSIFKGEFSFHIIYYQCLYAIPKQSYAYRKKLQFNYPPLQRGEVPLGRFLYEESAFRRVKFNMILKKLKFFLNFNCYLK